MKYNTKWYLAGILVWALLSADFAPATTSDAAEQWVTYFTDLSYPPRHSLRDVMNPWGEQIVYRSEKPDGWENRLLLACEAYYRQKIRFDGFPGSAGDGARYMKAIDQQDLSYVPNFERNNWDTFRTGIVDDMTERLWLSSDFLVHALSLAGFPIRWAMKAHFEEYEDQGSTGPYPWDSNVNRLTFYRQLNNIHVYFQQKQTYFRDLIGRERYLDEGFRPQNEFRPGDIVFFGRYGGDSRLGAFEHVRNCGVVINLDRRGLPDEIYNMRMPQLMREKYSGEINFIREIDGQLVRFRHFYDRYPIIGHGRIDNWFESPPEAHKEAPVPNPQPTGLEFLPEVTLPFQDAIVTTQTRDDSQPTESEPVVGPSPTPLHARPRVAEPDMQFPPDPDVYPDDDDDLSYDDSYQYTPPISAESEQAPPRLDFQDHPTDSQPRYLHPRNQAPPRARPQPRGYRR